MVVEVEAEEAVEETLLAAVVVAVEERSAQLD